MSHTLESMAVEDQVSTPTPGSPRPYITAESHDRLDSIQLSSDASGEFITTHSPRSFLGPPGEALSELRNALNPPWLHGPTGTPPSLVGAHRANRDGRWVDEALRLVDQPVVDVLANTELARLSLGRGLILGGDITHLSSAQPSMPLLSTVNALPKVHLDRVSTSPLPHTSPFDKPVDSAKRAAKPDCRANDNGARQGKQAFNSQDARSGDASSEEGEAWPMPETPFLASDVWASNTAPSEHGKQGQTRPGIAIKLQRNTAAAPEPPKATNDHRKATIGGGRGQGLISLHRAKEGERRVGRCKMYNCDKGVGFLIDDRLEEVPYDVKIHWTDLYSDQEFKSLAKGEIVEYTLNITTNGYSASYVTGPGGRPVMGAEQTIVQASRQTSYKLFKAGALPVKTYKSKWDDVTSPGLPECSPLASGNSAAARSPVNPRANQALPADNRIPIQGANPALALHLPSQVRTTSGQSPVGQLATPLWAPLRSPVNVINTHGSIISGLPGAHTPLPGLSHSALTPHSVESYNSMLLGGYTPNPLQSVRSSAIQIATPGDHANPFLANRLLRHAHPPMHHHDLQSLLAERQMLLQHQAALMNLYQNAGQPTSAAAIQTLNQISAQNSVKKNMATNEVQFYGGLLNRAGGLLEPQSQFLGLLPPIALPTNKEPYNPTLKLNDTARNRAAGAWRSPEFMELKMDAAVASLRPNAETFTPSGTEALSYLGMPIPKGFRDNRNSNWQDPCRRVDGQVYQVPARRSVSDSASAAATATKKHSALAHPQSRQPNPPQAPNTGATKQAGEKVISSKRVTFAEQCTPSRRAVSYGEAPIAGTPEDSSPSLEAEDHEYPEHQVAGAQSQSPNLRSSTEQYTLEESCRVGDVKSVEIALERLREAAAPRRLSLRNSQALKKSPDNIEATRSDLTDQDRAIEKPQPGRASASVSDTAGVRTEFPLSIMEGVQTPAQLAA